MSNEIKKHIKRKVNGLNCKNDLKCVDYNSEAVFMARSDHIEAFFKCDNPKPNGCPNSEYLANELCCKCGLRQYVSKNFK
jgi:hypothetical protein